MVHNNKVLTVSYGTFSCTLEGFEDSFGTMKAIAEYFRDLASDDRYFGAEPPQPDAEMLARIAQREVTRQVEARTSSAGIHLRAADPVATPAQPESPPTAHRPANTATTADRPAVDAAPAVAPAVVEPVEVESAEDTPAESHMATEVAQEEPVDLSTVDLFEEEQPEEEPTVDLSSVELFEEEEPVDLSSVDLFEENETVSQATEQRSSVAASEPVRAEAAPEPDPVPARPTASVDMATIAAISAAVAGNAPDQDPPSEEVEFFSEQELEPADAAAAPLHPETPRDTDAGPAADSIAAKLQRIRAVVAQTPQDDFSEDEHAESFVETARTELAQTEGDDDDASYEDSENASNADADEISRVLDRLDLTGHATAVRSASDKAAEPTLETESLPESDITLFDDALDEGNSAAQDQQPAPTDRTLAEETPQEPTQTRRDIRLARRKRREATTTNTLPENTVSEVRAEERPEVQPEAQTENTSQSPAQPPQNTKTPPPATPRRARIVKIKRADLQKAMSAGNLEEVEEEDQQDSAPVVESSLNAAEEAELLRELAEVEADLLASNQKAAPIAADKSTSNTAASDDAAEETRSKTSEPRNAPLPPDNDVSRLMAAAETKLEDPANATSRETYSQLRAAVAAAEADRSAAGRSVETDDAEPYREDLASVVRPRRPGSGGNRAARPRSTDSRPAPLKLVAEQRIDPAPKEPAQPVQPRRISVPKEDTPTEVSGSFADYARDCGAAELQDLLEAAAAYLSFVEGRDHFSRPQLMNKVRSIGHADFNRENGLRFFGQLLREGKIERATNGHFSATDDTGFRPTKRAAG